MIELNDVSVFYKQDKKLDSLNVNIQTGDKVGITGHSGAGKSLFIKTILGLLTPEWTVKGNIMLLNQYSLKDISIMEKRQLLKKYISYIPQDTLNALNPYIPVLEQLKTEWLFLYKGSTEQAEKESIHWLKKVGITGSKNSLNVLPKDYSGGMKQRVVCALALMKQPKILIADEPSSALDLINQLNMLTLLKSYMQDEMTLLYVSHSPAMIKELCNKVILFHQGKVLEFTDKNKFFDTPQTMVGKELLYATKELAKYGKMYS
ncbi:ATP-binding cassette domain-containing protein [Granulicatella sp. zg-ZJ]|uniref:ATP-binding cassette domain-containing protein n=1 Tax=Granulicatella sp. zg-ZJ TaxID=2678504 RepID=UPI0013D0E9CE|nr:ATP-binding cassette domain-containing protein [Granulicatella sp. zg-ZJ]MBS4749619.1 ABC transporter ATP-binding protein [Carnobacteriaceae bacterium zg-ZUI78]NEW62409.1 ATP-binding cassette domain-containing protein [Granulicatella sp. zg-ZJ]